jgi:hypothetical protein
MKTVVFIYETEQIKLLDRLMHAAGKDAQIIACTLEIEFLLEKRGVAFSSARDLRRTPPGDRRIYAGHLGQELLSAPELSFFKHRGVNLGKLFIFALQDYLALFLYHIDMVATALEEPYERVVLFSTLLGEGPASGVLGSFQSRVFLDAVNLISTKQGIVVEVLTPPILQGSVRDFLRRHIFTIKRKLFGLVVHLLNTLVRTVRSKKKIHILASELWKNIGPLMKELPEIELTLIDRGELFTIGLRNIFQNRMQFLHIDDFVTSAMRRSAAKQAEMFINAWSQVEKDNTPSQKAEFRGYSLVSLINQVTEHILTSSEKAIREIDGGWRLMEELRPDLVMVRASTSAQTHFAILCEVARLQNIPSLEIQHGIFSVSPQSFTSDRAAEYIAEYGPFEARHWHQHGYAHRSKFLDIGSPRFDAYPSMRGETPASGINSFEVLSIAPEVWLGGWSDSYDVFDYFSTMAAAARNVPQAHITIKLRPDPMDEAFFREAIRRSFADVPHSVAHLEPLAQLLKKADAVVSYHSTALLEALIFNRPVIFQATLPIYAVLAEADFASHQAAGVLTVAQTKTELVDALSRLSSLPERHAISKRVQVFMKENYALDDGKASSRLAQAIRTLAMGKGQR